jgi:O-antigen biosynthesis protein
VRIAIVVPRYGPNVVGGAETLARSFAEATARQGWEVEVWTTCAHDHYTWENVRPPGHEAHQGVVIRRFQVAWRDRDCHAALNNRLSQQGYLPVADQYAWLESSVHAPSLYNHVSRHAVEFDAVIALPCATPLIHYAAWAAPERVVVWPCLHDEPLAYLESTRLLLESAWGAMFLSPEERDLAIRRLRTRPHRCGVVRGGIAPQTALASRPRVLTNTLLYVGRLEAGKGLPLLYDYVLRSVGEGGGLRLVVLGRGPLKPPRHPAFEYRGFVSEAEKSRAYASALALCQPSTNESFSITVMESWLATRPVLVHSACAVTQGHVRRSRGGLWFQTYEEFVGAVEWLQTNPVQAARMGENGCRYVLSNYTWDIVAPRFERMIRSWEGKRA